MFRLATIREKGLHLSIIWDILMSLLALVNLSLILFDLTYLWVRPYYFRFIPQVTELYDPVKGIEKHRMTDEYLRDFKKLQQTYQNEKKITPEIIDLAIKLDKGSSNIIDKDPFVIAGMSGNLEELKRRIRLYIHKETGNYIDSYKKSFTAFFQFTEGNIEQRLTFFDKEIVPLVEINYFRKRALSGDYMDNFWMLDLPFLIIFALEFFIRWIMSVRRKQYIRWFIFPFYNWYDLLGLIPAKEFRIFRLFRLVSIYMRLRRSEFTTIGDDIITKTVKKYSNIITEEISDMVAVRILSEVQDELSHGSSIGIISEAIMPKKEEIKELFLTKLQIITHKRLMPLKRSVKELTRVSLEKSVTEGKSPLSRIPLPESILRPLSTEIGDLIVETVFSTIDATVNSNDGQTALAELFDEAFDITIGEMASSTMDSLVQDILMQSIENVKQRVSVKKWAESE